MTETVTSLQLKYPDAYTGKQKKYWVEIQLVDELENPVINMPYKAENDATRSTNIPPYTGKSDGSGIIRIEGLHPLPLTLKIEAKPLADEMEQRELRPKRGEQYSTVKPRALMEGYQYQYVTIGQLCDQLPKITPEWKDQENPPAFHFPDKKFKGILLKELDSRHVIEICPFRAWSLILHKQTDYSIVNAYNLGVMADLVYAAGEEINNYFNQKCIDLSNAPNLHDGTNSFYEADDMSPVPKLHKGESDFYPVVKDVPFSQRYIDPTFITTNGNIIKPDTQFFYVSNAEHVIVSWRGTQEVRDWLSDVTFSPLVCPSYLSPEGKIHKGFLDAFECAKNQALLNFRQIKNIISTEQKELFLCGHSLGGALALIYAAELKEIKPLLYTYGMPRVFTGDAILQLSDVTHYRHVNDSDTVTSVPPDVNVDNWFYELYDPLGTPLGVTWSTVELISQKASGVKIGDCFWHHGNIALFFYTTQVVQSLQCENGPLNCKKIKYRLPKKTKYYLVPALAEEKSISARNHDIQFIKTVSPKDREEFFPEHTNPDTDSIGSNPLNHFMPSAYLPYLNNQLVELVCPTAHLYRKVVREDFETQMDKFSVPIDERERNKLFSALQNLLSETLKVTEHTPEGKRALERFAVTKKEYEE